MVSPAITQSTFQHPPPKKTKPNHHQQQKPTQNLKNQNPPMKNPKTNQKQN